MDSPILSCLAAVGKAVAKPLCGERDVCPFPRSKGTEWEMGLFASVLAILLMQSQASILGHAAWHGGRHLTTKVFLHHHPASPCHRLSRPAHTPVTGMAPFQSQMETGWAGGRNIVPFFPLTTRFCPLPSTGTWSDHPSHSTQSRPLSCKAMTVLFLELEKAVAC